MGTSLDNHTQTLETLVRSYIGIDILRHLLLDLLGRSGNTTVSVVMRNRMQQLFPGKYSTVGRAHLLGSYKPFQLHPDQDVTLINKFYCAISVCVVCLCVAIALTISRSSSFIYTWWICCFLYAIQDIFIIQVRSPTHRRTSLVSLLSLIYIYIHQDLL